MARAMVEPSKIGKATTSALLHCPWC
ncbi:uncharacterized protein G2W53_012283 [Senna tora]|uniref:Uncharacterized protein n=1 Tax=Senna tora TaxID=362788 RepID=A0A834TWN0_9FABA|nr:uncharacterized protein G2W53_012283 [Senna tora]